MEKEVGQSDSLFMFWHGEGRATLLKYEYQITSEGDRRRHVPTFPAPTQPVAPRPSPHLGNHYTRSTSGRIRFNQFQFHRPSAWRSRRRRGSSILPKNFTKWFSGIRTVGRS